MVIGYPTDIIETAPTISMEPDDDEEVMELSVRDIILTCYVDPPDFYVFLQEIELPDVPGDPVPDPPNTDRNPEANTGEYTYQSEPSINIDYQGGGWAPPDQSNQTKETKGKGEGAVRSGYTRFLTISLSKLTSQTDSAHPEESDRAAEDDDGENEKVDENMSGRQTRSKTGKLPEKSAAASTSTQHKEASGKTRARTTKPYSKQSQQQESEYITIIPADPEFEPEQSHMSRLVKYRPLDFSAERLVRLLNEQTFTSD